MVEDKSIVARIAEIERLAAAGQDMNFHEVCLLAATVLHDTVGDAHPLVQAFREAKASTWGAKIETAAAVRTLLLIYRQGALGNPVLRVAKDVEGEILAIAEAQVRAAGSSADTPSQQMRLAVAAFLAGAALEDALRRLCDKNSITYESDRTTLAKLQAALYSPSRNVEFITSSDTKAITSWGDTRNKAAHGHFDQLGGIEVGMMVIGVRDFIARILA
jgi:hypothetical protein